jgi:hypothetical protein
MVIGRPKPDGAPYTNTDPDWLWLQGDAGKAARWLGYIPFEQITDQRNAGPVIREFSRSDPWPYLTVGIDVDIPSASDIMPKLGIEGFRGEQPYHLVMFGEKSSLEDVLGPTAATYGADLYLPTGEISDTLLHGMATSAVADGRPMVVLCFSDADPADWQMPISIARKLQAFSVLLPGMPDFEVHRVALTPGQVAEYGLPSTPLKETERRADRWRAAMGVEQTEIDALASLRPDLLVQIAREALGPFFDRTLDQRVMEAQSRWLEEALDVVNQGLDSDRLGRIRGMRVIVTGRLRQRSYETREGEKRTVFEVEADDVGPSLRNASAKVSKTTRSGSGSGGGFGGTAAEPAADPWSASDSGFSDEPPF